MKRLYILLVVDYKCSWPWFILLWCAAIIMELVPRQWVVGQYSDYLAAAAILTLIIIPIDLWAKDPLWDSGHWICRFGVPRYLSFFAHQISFIYGVCLPVAVILYRIDVIGTSLFMLFTRSAIAGMLASISAIFVSSVLKALLVDLFILFAVACMLTTKIIVVYLSRVNTYSLAIVVICGLYLICIQRDKLRAAVMLFILSMLLTNYIVHRWAF